MKHIYSLVILLVVIFSGTNIVGAEKGDNEPQKTKIEFVNNQVIVYGNISFPDNFHMPYNMLVVGDLTAGNGVKFLGNVEVRGNIILGNRVNISKKMKGDTIVTGSYLQVNRLESSNNTTLHGEAVITQGVLIGGDFTTGSNFSLSGNSKIKGNMKVGMETDISGNVYVYGSFVGHEEMIFNGEKLRIRGDFRTLKKSVLTGRIYMYGKSGHRYIYGTEIVRHRYEAINTQYKGIMKGVDPILSYTLSGHAFERFRQTVYSHEKNISRQKKKISRLQTLGKSQYVLDSELKQLINMQNMMFDYITQYIEKDIWDGIEWKKLKFEERTNLKTYIYQTYKNTQLDF
ncbi:MAG: hypothetical protein GY828_04540 [Candidatus Gracilibacteria bacterium]|nr:hypothetical protein [Candidatus Gracilibacteria bacterium]